MEKEVGRSVPDGPSSTTEPVPASALRASVPSADLVERLREESRACQSVAWARQDGGQDYCIAANLADEAADLIERLTTEEAALEQAPDLAELILKIGWAEWGQTPAHDAEGHGEHVAESVRITADNFGQTGPQHMHGLYAKGTETVICHTGTSPNSPQIARALTGAWNKLVEAASAIETRRAETLGSAHESAVAQPDAQEPSA